MQRARQEGGREGLRTSPWAWRLWASLTGPSREKAAGLGAGEGAGQELSVLARLGFLAQALWADHNSGGKAQRLRIEEDQLLVRALGYDCGGKD